MSETNETHIIEPYFLIRLSPKEILYQVIDGQKILEENTIDILDIHVINDILTSYQTLPVYLVLKEWDVSIKHLDLRETSWYNKTLIRYEFQKGEFEEKDIFICQPSSIVKGLYRFILIDQNHSLDHALLSLSSMKNTLITTEIEEHLHLKNLLKDQHLTTLLNWHFLLIFEDERWKIVVGFGNDLMLVRHGTISSTFSSIDKENSLLKEVTETIKYLKRLGLTNDDQIAFYTDPKLFKTTTLSSYGLLLIDSKQIDIDSISPPIFYEKILEKIKAILKFDFYRNTFKIPSFFWHSFFYKLPQYIINGLSPIVLFSTVFCLIYGVKLSYYRHAAGNIEKQMQLVEPLKNEEEQELEKSNLLSVFKKHYKKNPVLIFKQVSQSLESTLIAKTVDWVLDKDRIKITLELTEKTKHPKKKDFAQETKEKVGNMLHEKLPMFTPQWHQKSKTALTLTLVGPSQ